MGMIEEQILDRLFEQLETSEALTSEVWKALRALLYAPGAPKADKIMAALTLQDAPPPDHAPDHVVDAESAS